MKIRADFVTNSSSSSFIALAQKCTLNEYLSGAVPPGLTVATFGTYLSEGIDMIELTPDLAQYIVENYDNFNDYDRPDGDCYILLDSSYDEGELKLSGDNMTKASPKFGPLVVVSYTVDYHCSQSREDIKNTYMDRNY